MFNCPATITRRKRVSKATVGKVRIVGCKRGGNGGRSGRTSHSVCKQVEPATIIQEDKTTYGIATKEHKQHKTGTDMMNGTGIEQMQTKRTKQGASARPQSLHPLLIFDF